MTWNYKNVKISITKTFCSVTVTWIYGENVLNVHPKMIILTWFTHLDVAPEMCIFTFPPQKDKCFVFIHLMVISTSINIKEYQRNG